MKIQLNTKVRITVTENRQGVKFYYLAFKEITGFKSKKYNTKAELHTVLDYLASDLSQFDDPIYYNGGSPEIPLTEKIVAMYEFSQTLPEIGVVGSIGATVCVSISPVSSQRKVTFYPLSADFYNIFNTLVIPLPIGGGGGGEFIPTN